jgi:hypothetical protein
MPPIAAPPSAVPATVSLSRCFFQKLRWRRTRRRVRVCAAAAAAGCADTTELIGSTAKPSVNRITTTATYRFIFCTTKDAFIRSPLSSLMTASQGAKAVPVAEEFRFRRMQGLKPQSGRDTSCFSVWIRGVNVRKYSSGLEPKPSPSQTSTPRRSCNSASRWV